MRLHLLFFTFFLISMHFVYHNFFQKYMKREILACVRTKDSMKYMHELILYYKYHGVTDFQIYDDSIQNNMIFFNKYNNVIYKYVGDVEINNENHHIQKCMKDALLLKRYKYVLCVDDDDFFYPSDATLKIIDILESNQKWFKNSYCIAAPLTFFGTLRSYNTGLTTLDFIHSERPVKEDVYSRYSSSSSNKKKKRIEKAIFKSTSDNEDLLNLLDTKVKNGALMHGYGVNCEKQWQIKVAHYTRSEVELKKRISTFWKNIKHLKNRFSTKNNQFKYILERNRTEYKNNEVRKMALLVFNSTLAINNGLNLLS